MPLVAVNCGALPDTLLESELFGYVRGAFTDARGDKMGRFALAHRGTLFLDEVESLSTMTQVKLLRVLQENEFNPLGATAPEKADVRVVAATKEDLPPLAERRAVNGGVLMPRKRTCLTSAVSGPLGKGLSERVLRTFGAVRASDLRCRSCFPFPA